MIAHMRESGEMPAADKKDPFSESFPTVHDWKFAMLELHKTMEFGETKFFQAPSGKQLVLIDCNNGEYYLLSSADSDTRYFGTYKSGVEALIAVRNEIGEVMTTNGQLK